VFHPAAAIELLHTFALLHDDVMDRSATRRGRPTAQVSLSDAHRAAGRNGDAGWFGASAAVLAGDLVYVWADELLDRAPLSPPALNRARAVFTTLREEVIAGQHLDLLLAADPSADEARARHVALLKSARYTVTRPLLLGAALAPPAAGVRVERPLTTYGDAVGLAFQLRDDILGLFGEPSTTGKSDLDDLHEGKRTVLMLRALRLADDAQRSMLQAALGDPDLDEAGADRVREVVVATGALASVEARLTADHARALEAIDEVPEPARSALVDLAQLAIRRAT
jgi:geranylgeranyl diphosphate synthase, type I